MGWDIAIEAMSTGKIWHQVSTSLTIYDDEIEERFVLASGPGGQNVNKVATAVQLRFYLYRAQGLSEFVKSALYKQAAGRIGQDGTLLIEAKRFRSQERNRADARDRLAELIKKAAEPPAPPRRPTKPTYGATLRRLKEKTGRGTIKQTRGKVSTQGDDE
jgi:ribosome-associated protein